MKIITTGGLIGTLELMRRYQQETTDNGRVMADKWLKEIDAFIIAWKKNGINGSTPLFNEQAPPDRRGYEKTEDTGRAL
jgi:hypothetical protein